MTSTYLGVACTGHDNAVAIVNENGVLIFAEATERAVQSKRALGCPPDDVNRIGPILREYVDAGARLVVARTWSDAAVAKILSGREKVDGGLRAMEAAGSDRALSQPLREMQYVSDLVTSGLALAGRGAWLHAAEGHDVEFRGFDHHLTHAAAGCFSSPFEEAACAVVDGYGEDGSCRFFSWRGGRLTPIDAGVDRGEGGSLGLFFGNLTRWCGFDPWKGEEWKVMGLAAYGRRDGDLYRLMSQTLRIDGLRLVRPASAIPAYVQLQKRARAPGADARTVADLARTGQEFFADRMTELLENFHELGISPNLVLSGGCALNSAYNGQVVERTGFRHLHVFAAPADDGNAAGAAWCAWRQDHPEVPRSPLTQSPFVGSAFLREALQNLARFGGVSRREADPAETAARLLAEGKVVGWAQGRAELGPRALGNRSILADPRLPAMKDRLNAEVKFREEFRPFAPSVLHEHGSDWFENYQESPYMERALRFRPGVRGRVPAVVHVDGTGRLQSVRRETAPTFHALIEAFRRRTGVPLVLNTSFNVMGRPIIHSVEDALGVFFTTGLDALMIEDRLIEKETR